MIKKSEVNVILGAGVLAAHGYKCMVSLHGNTASLEYLQTMCEIMAESLIAIDSGYSCTSEEMDAELHALSSEDDAPPEVKIAMTARKIMKQIEGLDGEERLAKMHDLASEYRKGIVK